MKKSIFLSYFMFVPCRLHTTASNGTKAKPHGKAAEVSERQ